MSYIHHGEMAQPEFFLALPPPWGGVISETHSPRSLENPGTQKCSTPRGGKGGVGLFDTHPPPQMRHAVQKNGHCTVLKKLLPPHMLVGNLLVTGTARIRGRKIRAGGRGWIIFTVGITRGLRMFPLGTTLLIFSFPFKCSPPQSARANRQRARRALVRNSPQTGPESYSVQGRLAVLTPSIRSACDHFTALTNTFHYVLGNGNCLQSTSDPPLNGQGCQTRLYCNTRGSIR